MYDSLYKTVSKDLVHLIATTVYSPLSELKIVMIDVDKQSNVSDCGVLSILENCQVLRFPTVAERKVGRSAEPFILQAVGVGVGGCIMHDVAILPR